MDDGTLGNIRFQISRQTDPVSCLDFKLLGSQICHHIVLDWFVVFFTRLEETTKFILRNGLAHEKVDNLWTGWIISPSGYFGFIKPVQR